MAITKQPPVPATVSTSAARWNRRAADHESAKAPLVSRVRVQTGEYVDFIDTRGITPDGGVLVIALGRTACERAGFYVNAAGATPAEVFTALAPRDECLPDRLLEDHCDWASSDHALSDTPRQLSSGAVFRQPC